MNTDGTIPADNPFLNTPGALPSVYSLGNRNPQGLAFHPGNIRELNNVLTRAVLLSRGPIITEEGMLAAMAEVGRQFEEGECYVPEMMVSARAMKAGLAKLQPSRRRLIWSPPTHER